MFDSFETTGSREGTNERVGRKYYLANAASEDDVFDFFDTLPADIGGLPRAGFEYHEIPQIVGTYEINVDWGLSRNQGAGQAIDTLEYKFNFQAPSGHVKQSLATISVTTAAGTVTLPATDKYFQGAINVVNDGGKMRVEGEQVSPPPEIYTLAYRVNDTVITGAYQQLVRQLCGRVASTAFRGEAAGSVMLVRVTGGRESGGVWHIEFGFGGFENDTDIPFGNLVVPAKDGLDLLWGYYRPSKDNDLQSVVKTPVYAFVERVWKRDDLNQLALPA